MKSNRVIIPAVCLIPLLSSCASYQKTADSDAWSVKPAYSVRHSTEKPDAYYQLGRYYQGQNRYEQAKSAYQKALALDGGYVEARNGLGVIYSMQDRLPEAIEQFRMAAGQAPAAAHIHNNLGYALYLSGFYAEAAQILEHALALDPANRATHANLAQAKEKAGSAGPVLAQASQSPLAEKPALESRDVQVPAEQPAVVSPVSSPVIAAAVTTSPAPTALPEEKVAEQVAPAPVVAQLQIKEEVVAVAPASATPTVSHQPELPQVKDAGAEAVAERNSVPVVESRMQVVQLAPNVYELLERAESQRALAPAAQAVAQARGMIMPVAHKQSQHKPGRMAEGRIQVAGLAHANERREQVEPQAKVASVPTGTAKSYRIEVSNGNGVTGMARKVAAYLEGYGYDKSRLTNQQPFQTSSSEVHYRAGYQEQARSLMASLPGQPTLVKSNDLRQDISIKVVLGKDWSTAVAYFDRAHQGKIRLARNGSDS